MRRYKNSSQMRLSMFAARLTFHVNNSCAGHCNALSKCTKTGYLVFSSLQADLNDLTSFFNKTEHHPNINLEFKFV